MFLTRITLAAGAAWVVLSLTACVTAPTQTTLVAAYHKQVLPPLVPVRRFVANIDATGGYVLSPDGERLAWQQAVGLDSGLAVRRVAQGSAVTTFPVGNQGRGGGFHTWLGDSRHLVYSKDFTGDENIQIFVQDADSAFEPWAVTPWVGVRSVYLGRSGVDGHRFFFASNKRDKSTLDLYEADVATRSLREVARSDGTVLGWMMGADRQLVGRARQLGPQDGADVVYEWLQPDGDWKPLKTVGGFDSYGVNRVDTAAGKAWVTSNLGRDKSALIEVDLASGQERLIASHDQVDVSYPVFGAAGSGLVGYVVEPDFPHMVYLDESLGQEVQAAQAQAVAQGLLSAEPVMTRPQSFSDDNQRVVLRSQGLFDVAELLLDRRTGQVTRLNPLQTDAPDLLAAQEPFSFKASDGRTMHGYIIRPKGVEGPVPMVVEIHGGPWVRDSWSPAVFNTRQLLANRGYAVMLLNYRGSAGYGRDHLGAGERVYFGRLQQDIAEGVQWAIDQKVADPARLAVLGGSFGGFSVLAQLIQKPHDYRCGIDVVGVANWPRVIDNWPPFWRSKHIFARFYGDVTKPQDRAQMLQNSPISHLEKITAPLLVIHGGNDVRVLRQDSDDVVAALRKRAHPVTYVVYPDEGHSISKWRNRLDMWRTIEDTLASCLGGRSAGFDLYQLMPR